MHEVELAPVGLERLEAILSPERTARLEATAEQARRAFAGRTVWHVSSTATGGGVAEMLQTLLAYGNGAGVANRWLVLEADPGFFGITKRLHHMLHGETGDGGALGAEEREHYRMVLAGNAAGLTDRIGHRDVVVLHDPQTAGLVHDVRRTGAAAVWRCHVGRDRPNRLTDVAWAFLRPHVGVADAVVFSRREYAPDWVEPPRLRVIAPSIDPFSAKNMDLAPAAVTTVLAQVGLLGGDGDDGDEGDVPFGRRGGGVGVVRRHRNRGGLVLDGDPPPAHAPLVVQVSRWDRLKDMAGVMAGFARMLEAPGAPADVHLMLVGPETSGVSDDPEGDEVLAECRTAWRALPDGIRERVHLAAVPMDDIDENAVIVNAVQRHARVVVQKSLVEGFGLTVTEAMWKGKPIVTSRVGGIQDQIRDGRDGLLLRDPTDLDEFAAALRRVLDDDALADRLGAAARARVVDEYVGDRHLQQYAELLGSLLARPPS